MYYSVIQIFFHLITLMHVILQKTLQIDRIDENSLMHTCLSIVFSICR